MLQISERDWYLRESGVQCQKRRHSTALFYTLCFPHIDFTWAARPGILKSCQSIFGDPFQHFFYFHFCIGLRERHHLRSLNQWRNSPHPTPPIPVRSASEKSDNRTSSTERDVPLLTSRNCSPPKPLHEPSVLQAPTCFTSPGLSSTPRVTQLSTRPLLVCGTLSLTT